MNMEAVERRKRSIETLRRQGVPFMEGLPVIESAGEAKIRSAEAIAKRAVCSLLTIQHACTLLKEADAEESHRLFYSLLHRYGVQSELTARERKVFEGGLPKQDLIQVAWQYECVWVLLWALSYVEKLSYPTDICDCDFTIESVARHENMDDFMEHVHLRTDDEILDETDLAFRYDWACVEASIHHESAPAGLNPEVVVERHKALNWLIGYGDDWDNLRSDT